MRIARRTIVIPAGVLLFAALAYTQQPPSAADILDEAKAQAASGQRDIFAIFHASWCGWCRQLDKFIGSPEIAPVIQKYFVPIHITVLERDEKKALDTPGGDELMARLGGTEGLPFFAFLDGQGAPIVNSIRPGEGGKPGVNIGHPVEPYEIDWFMTMLHKAVPGITSQEAAPLEAWLRAQKK
jgi:thioredoxin-related protein